MCWSASCPHAYASFTYLDHQISASKGISIDIVLRTPTGWLDHPLRRQCLEYCDLLQDIHDLQWQFLLRWMRTDVFWGAGYPLLHSVSCIRRGPHLSTLLSSTMCFGENCAPQAVRYINAQLTALYDNAVECLEEHGNAQNLEDHFRYSHALAEYFYGQYGESMLSRENSKFCAIFDQPRLDFICNHDAVLRLRIREGHYDLDYDVSSMYSNPKRVRAFSELELNLRVGFDVEINDIPDARRPHNKNILRTIVLDFENARWIDAKLPQDPTVLMHYVHAYLRFLERAGTNVFFSLPDFDDTSYRLTIDHSFTGDNFIDAGEIYSYSVSAINAQLLLSWEKAAKLAKQFSDDVTDWNPVALAEYRGAFLKSNVQFHLKLGAPRLQAICSKEAILFLSIQFLSVSDINYLDQAGDESSEWTIALQTHMILEGRGSCAIDSNDVRVCENLCKLPQLDAENQILQTHLLDVLEFIRTQYLLIIGGDSGFTVYDPQLPNGTLPNPSNGTLPNPPNDTPAPDYVPSQAISIPSKIIKPPRQHSPIYDVLVEWSYGSYFSATFKPWDISFLSSGKAIVWVRIDKCQFKLLRDGEPVEDGALYKCEDWELAFEVDVKLATDVSVESAIPERHFYFSEFSVFKYLNDLKASKLCDLWHVYLNFRDARFIPGLSRHEHDDICYYLRLYLLELCNCGFHIINTVPIWTSSPPPDGWTALWPYPYVHSSADVTYDNVMSVSHDERPVMFIWGMTDFRPFPSDFSPSSSLLDETQIEFAISGSEGESACGIVTVSRATVLDQALRDTLSRNNAMTTVIPLLYPIDDDSTWDLPLTTWAQRKKRGCEWNLVKTDDDSLMWKWEYRAAFTYEHEGDGVVSIELSASCKTNNYMEMRNASTSEGLEMKVRGSIEAEGSFKSGITNQRSVNAGASWSASFVLQSGPSGVIARITDSTSPVISKNQYDGDAESAIELPDLNSSLASQLPHALPSNDVLQTLKRFEGPWGSCYPGMQACFLARPTLNSRGDVIFELRLPLADSTSSDYSEGSITEISTSSEEE